MGWNRILELLCPTFSKPDSQHYLPTVTSWELLLLATSTEGGDLLLYDTASTATAALAESLRDRRVQHHHTTRSARHCGQGHPATKQRTLSGNGKPTPIQVLLGCNVRAQQVSPATRAQALHVAAADHPARCSFYRLSCDSSWVPRPGRLGVATANLAVTLHMEVTSAP